jgi:ABC-type Fe3+-hydroxamate transport system substrate-binding protein
VIPAHARRRLAGFVLLPALLAASLAACGASATPAPTPAGPSPTAVIAPPATGRVSTPSPSPSALAATYPLTLTDDEGTAVTIPATPTTIVSLTPATTEILFAVGAGPRVRGVTDADDYPPAAKQITQVVKLGSVDIEKIVGLGADLVIAGGNGFNSPEVIAKLRSLGIPVIVVYASDVAGVYRDIQLVAAARGIAAGAGGGRGGCRGRGRRSSPPGLLRARRDEGHLHVRRRHRAGRAPPPRRR